MAKRKLKRPGGPSSLEALWALWAWKPFGPEGLLGLGALQAWKLFGPVGFSGLSLTPTISTTILSGGSESCFNPFPYFSIFLRDTFFLKIHTGQTDRPIQFFFSPKRVEMSKLP